VELHKVADGEVWWVGYWIQSQFDKIQFNGGANETLPPLRTKAVAKPHWRTQPHLINPLPSPPQYHVVVAISLVIVGGIAAGQNAFGICPRRLPQCLCGQLGGGQSLPEGAV